MPRKQNMPNGGFKVIKENILNTYKIKNNKYSTVSLRAEGKRKSKSIHRLVAEAFIDNPDPENKTQVNHIDGNKQNNSVSNLEWVNAKENVQHAIKNKLRKTKAIIQYDKKRNYIKEWGSISEASKMLNIPSPNIINCCKGKCKVIGGFIWEYK